MNQSISIPLSFPSVSDAGYWIRVEQPDAEDGATQAEAAALIDEVFSISPCVEVETEVPTEPITQDDFKELIKEDYDIDICNLTYDKDYTCLVNVILSDPEKPYKLVLTNGSVLETRVIQERREERLVVNNATSVELPYPVVSNAIFRWEGKIVSSSSTTYMSVNSSTFYPGTKASTGLSIRLNGKNLEWDQKTTGVILASYDTTYFQHEVIVYNDDQEAGECQAIGFYQNLAAGIDLKIPYTDEEDYRFKSGYCKTQVKKGDEDEDKPRWTQTETRYYCECSGKYHHSIYSEEPQGADRFNYTWPALINVVNGGYINCGEETGDISDPEFYKQTCCVYPSFGLPHCSTYYRLRGSGAELPEDIRNSYINQYGENTVKFTSVAPEDGYCGKLTFKQKKVQKNCCVGVDPIAWDDDQSIDVISDNSMGEVYVTGGRPPFQWKVRGSGFYTDPAHTMREIETNGSVLQIYTANACGACRIEVTDGCSSTDGTVRSTVGTWESVDPESVPASVVPIAADTYIGSIGASLYCGKGYAAFQTTTGAYKFEQQYLVVTDGAVRNRYENCPGPCDGLTTDWEQFVETLKADRGGMPNDERELIDMDKSMNLVVAPDLVIFPASWNDADIIFTPDALGHVHTCYNASPSHCHTEAAILAGRREESSGCTTAPNAWRWIC